MPIFFTHFPFRISLLEVPNQKPPDYTPTPDFTLSRFKSQGPQWGGDTVAGSFEFFQLIPKKFSIESKSATNHSPPPLCGLALSEHVLLFPGKSDDDSDLQTLSAGANSTQSNCFICLIGILIEGKYFFLGKISWTAKRLNI